MAQRFSLPDLADRVEAAAALFASEEGPTGPLSASMAEDSELPVRILDELEPVHHHVGELLQAVDNTLRDRCLVKLVENHRGDAVFVEG
jgi:hypothetical protein